MRETPAALAAQAGEQCGLVTRAQCLEAGVTARMIQRRLELGLWVAVFPGVYLVSPGPASELQTLGGALLAVDHDALASHGSALWLADKRFPCPAKPQLSVDAKLGPRTPPGVELHRLPRLRGRGSFPRRTPPELAAIEQAQLLTTETEVITLVTDVLSRRLTTEGRLRAELAARPRHHWRSLLDDLLAEVAEGAQSQLEVLDLRNDRAHGLPTANRQVAVRIEGRRRWLDATIEVPETAALLQKELDGRLGHEGSGRFRDWARDNAAVLRGATPLRFGWLDYRTRPCATAAVQVFVLRRLGWTGQPRACGPRCTLSSDLAELARTYA